MNGFTFNVFQLKEYITINKNVMIEKWLYKTFDLIGPVKSVIIIVLYI